MAKRRGASHSGEAQYANTQRNLDKKGKTNKKLKRSPLATKYLTPKGKEIKEAAAEFIKAHPAGSGRRKQAKIKKLNEKITQAS